MPRTIASKTLDPLICRVGGIVLLLRDLPTWLAICSQLCGALLYGILLAE